jgi:leukotriene-A4 hydrolase
MDASPAVRRLLLLAALLVVVPAEARQRPAVVRDAPPPHDQFSAAEPAAVRTVHLALDLTIDFDQHKIRGSATHTIRNFSATTRFIVDTRDLQIHAVAIDGAPATWSLGTSTRAGQPLRIDITPATRAVRIDYETDPASEALTWLNSLQTTGGVAPFLFTFNQPDHARDWIPLQDTPGVRMPYNATIRVPPGLLALMSARNPVEPSGDGVYHLQMPYSVPSYLIALAVGRLEFHPLSERTGFYAEPEFVDDALWNLQYVPEMLEIAESMMGPYPFDRYDVLLAPPGYRGGMENPMLNFLNVLGAVQGDRESPPVPTELVAHELAHSWAGDLVTCATWSDTWLNEGFATYYAKRILEQMMGPERSEIGFYWDRQFYEDYMLRSDLRLTVLHREFLPTDSPSIFSPTTYNKGSIFLKMLEDRMGRDAFDSFMRSYFRRFALHWVDERAFLDELRKSPAIDDSLLLEEWIYGNRLPSNVTAPTRSALWDLVGVQATRFRSGTPASSLDTHGWRSFELSLFLWRITDVIPQRMAELDAAFGLSAMKSPSIHWFLGVATTLYGPAMPTFERYLLLGGPNVVPVYQRLAQSATGRAYALAIYERARPRYAPGTQIQVDLILGVQPTAQLRDAA